LDESSVAGQFVMPEVATPGLLAEAWAGGVEVAGARTLVVTLWDTFEWGIWHGGHVLLSVGASFRLCRREGGWIGAEVSGEEISGPKPRMARDFSNPAMREALGPMLGLRGLAAVGSARLRSRHAEFRNAAGKIVCRVEWVDVFRHGREADPVASFAGVRPLRGYEHDAEAVAEVIRANGGSSTGQGPLDAILRVAGHIPRVYTLRPVAGLEAGMSARSAVCRIARGIFPIIVENERRIPDDLDTEFLHDYRICLRKLRSLLSLMKGVFPDEATEGLRGVLGALARETNRLRDLDVCLLAREEYTELLPPVLREGVGGMFGDYEMERAAQFKKVASRLRSSAHRQRMESVGAFFENEADHGPSEGADVPVGPLAFRRIYRRYRKIRGIADTLGVETPDEAVHALRIECKKLRYLMEFFSELVPGNEADAMEKALRRLQNRLGQFNDYSVQQRSLIAYWKNRKGRAAEAPGLPLAVGGLISVLYQRQQEQRGEIQEGLDGFCSGATAAAFKRVFKLPVQSGPAEGSGS
jgi:CHAD domain-containing protein